MVVCRVKRQRHLQIISWAGVQGKGTKPYSYHARASATHVKPLGNVKLIQGTSLKHYTGHFPLASGEVTRILHSYSKSNTVFCVTKEENFYKHTHLNNHLNKSRVQNTESKVWNWREVYFDTRRYITYRLPRHSTSHKHDTHKQFSSFLFYCTQCIRALLKRQKHFPL